MHKIISKLYFKNNHKNIVALASEIQIKLREKKKYIYIYIYLCFKKITSVDPQTIKINKCRLTYSELDRYCMFIISSVWDHACKSYLESKMRVIY